MKRDILIAAVAVIVVLAVTFALSGLTRDLPLSASEPFRPEARGEEKRLAPDDKVVMRVNGEPITEREFNAFTESAPAEARPFYSTPAGRKALADELVKLKTLEQEARRRGLTENPDVRTELEMARAQITAGRALQTLVDETADARVQAEFDKEKKSSVSLRHILLAYQGGAVPPRQGGSAPSPDQATKEAQALVGRLRGGAEFEQVARERSDDQQTAPQGGNLGPARPDMLPEEIAAVVRNLQPGQISDPVRTQFGVHIFKVDEPSLEELRPMLRQRIRQQAAEEVINRLHSQAKVELDPEFFQGAPQQQ